MRFPRPLAPLGALLLLACGSAEPALAQRDTVKVHIEVPTTTVVRVDTVRPPVDSTAFVAVRDSLRTVQSANAQLYASFRAQHVTDSTRIAEQLAAAIARNHIIDSLSHLPPPVPPPPVHDTTHDTTTIVKIVTVDVAYDPTAVDSMKIWRVDTSPPTDLAAMPIAVGQSVPIRVDCFNHAKQQIDCPANLSITSSDPTVATVTIAPRSPTAPSTSGSVPPTSSQP